MELKIGWMNCKIKFKKKLFLDGDEVDGYFDPKKQIIVIDKSLPNDLRTKTLLHEIIHALLFVQGRHEDYADENLVDGMANNILMLLKNNKAEIPALLKIISF